MKMTMSVAGQRHPQQPDVGHGQHGHPQQHPVVEPGRPQRHSFAEQQASTKKGPRQAVALIWAFKKIKTYTVNCG